MATTAERLAQYEDAFNKAQAYNENAFKKDFEKAYNEATNYNKDLIDQRSQQLADLTTITPKYRAEYQDATVIDPATLNNVIAKERAQALANLSSSNNLLNARGNNYSSILGDALAAYQTEANQANTAAENAWRLYQDAVQQEQAAQQLAASRAAAAAASSQGSSLYDLLNQYGAGGDYSGGNNIAITVPDDTTSGGTDSSSSASNWTTSSSLPGLDYTQLVNGGNTLQKALAVAQSVLSPAQRLGSAAKTLGGAIGNLVGNKNNSNMSFVDKLLNRR